MYGGAGDDVLTSYGSTGTVHGGNGADVCILTNEVSISGCETSQEQ